MGRSARSPSLGAAAADVIADAAVAVAAAGGVLRRLWRPSSTIRSNAALQLRRLTRRAPGTSRLGSRAMSRTRRRLCHYQLRAATGSTCSVCTVHLYSTCICTSTPLCYANCLAFGAGIEIFEMLDHC